MNGFLSRRIGLCVSFLILFSCSNSDEFNFDLNIKTFPNRSEDFSLWQLDAFFHEVQMGYVLRTDDDKVIVIDGGGAIAAPYLKGYIKQLGGTVNTWVVTHAHDDHIGALLQIVGDKTIKIERLVHAPPELVWVNDHEPESKNLFERYNNVLAQSTIMLVNPSIGEKIVLGKGIILNILSVQNPEITPNAINNSSLVFRIDSRSKRVLFLGDLGREGGQKLVANSSIETIRADYVQMAHHGQNGVNKEFYQAVGASYALWPTPQWLWENKTEKGGYNSGDYKTIIVQQWMKEIGIKKNYVSGLDGTVQID